MPRKVEISHKTIIFTLALLGGLYFVYMIRDIILQVFVAIFIMAILNPTAKKLHNYRIPRGVSVLIVYLSAIGILVFSLANIVPALVEQTSHFANSLPLYLNELGIDPVIRDQLVNELIGQLRNLPSQIVNFSVSIFSNLITLLTILIFAFYLLMTRDKLGNQLTHFLGEQRAKEVESIIDKLEIELGGWARGQLALMLLVGGASYIGLIILSVPYALPLAIIAGIFEAVPYIGPWISAVPAVIIGFGISPVMGLATVALYFLIQQVENYLFVPKVMERAIGLTPIVTLLSLAIGFKVAGIWGVLMSVPVAITIRILVKHFTNK